MKPFEMEYRPLEPETSSVTASEGSSGSSSGKTQAQTNSNATSYAGASTAVVDATSKILADVAKRRQEANLRREKQQDDLRRSKFRQQTRTADARQGTQRGLGAISRGLPSYRSSFSGLPGYRR